MYTSKLVGILCLKLVAEYTMNTCVLKIKTENDVVTGVVTNTGELTEDIVVSDADIMHVYTKSLDQKYYPAKILNQ